MRYTITIKDNKTEEILTNTDVNCIIGAIDLDDSIKGIAYSDAKRIDVLLCAESAIEAANKTINDLFNRMKEENKDDTQA